MPAVSQQQQKLFGLALSVKRGDTPRSEASAEVLKIVDGMSEKEIEKYAGTEHSGLPKKVEQKLRETIRSIVKEKISVNEAPTRTAREIGGLTGMNSDFIQKFVDKHELDIEKVFQYVKKGKLKDRMDFVTALAGKPNNTIQKKMIKIFKESLNERVTLSTSQMKHVHDNYKNFKVSTLLNWQILPSLIKTFGKMDKKSLQGLIKMKPKAPLSLIIQKYLEGNFKNFESVNEIRKGSVVIPYAHDKYGEFIVDKVFKNKSGETSYTGKFKKSGEAREFILHSKDRVVKESVNEAKGRPKFKVGQKVNYIPKLSGLSPKKKLVITNVNYRDGDRLTKAGYQYFFKGTDLVAHEKDIKLAESVVSEKKVPKKGSPDYHQHKIAVDTVKNPRKSFMGGPSATEAEETLMDKFGYSKKEIEKLKESVNEAKRSVVHKAAKKGSFPVTLVVVKNGKVIDQELVNTPEAVPAAFNVIQSKHKGAIVHIEDKTGKRLFSESVNEADVKKKINRRGDIDGLLVKHNGKEYHIVYSGDFGISSTVMPYGIVMPGDDTVSFLSKDRNAKNIWKQLKPKVDKFLKSNESVVNENTVIKKLVSDYKSLKRAIDSPNYPDTTHTRAALIKIQNKIKQMAKKEEFKQEFEKLLPDFKYEHFVNEAATRTAMEIGGLTGMNKDAIQKFVDSNELDIEKVFQYVKKGKLKDRMDFVTAIAGKPGNPIQKKMIKMFQESVNEAKYTNQTGIKSSLLRDNEFSSLLSPKEQKWVRGNDVKIYKDRFGFIFTDGKMEMVFNIKRPMSVIKPIGRVRGEIKKLYTQNESVNEADLPGEAVGYIEKNGRKKLIKTFKSLRAGKMWLTKERDKYLNQPGVDRIGTMNKDNWDKFEARYAESINEAPKPKVSVTRKEWDRLHKDFKGMVDGQPYMVYLDKKTQATVYGPVHIKEEVVSEGRGFVNAARKAKEEGKTEFEYNGKTYPVTLKEGMLNEMTDAEFVADQLSNPVADGSMGRKEFISFLSKETKYSPKQLGDVFDAYFKLGGRDRVKLDNTRVALQFLSKFGVK